MRNIQRKSFQLFPIYLSLFFYRLWNFIDFLRLKTCSNLSKDHSSLQNLHFISLFVYYFFLFFFFFFLIQNILMKKLNKLHWSVIKKTFTKLYCKKNSFNQMPSLPISPMSLLSSNNVTYHKVTVLFSNTRAFLLCAILTIIFTSNKWEWRRQRPNARDIWGHMR